MANRKPRAPETPRPKRPWVEPKIEELDISRTANQPSVGGDGGVADCMLT